VTGMLVWKRDKTAGVRLFHLVGSKSVRTTTSTLAGASSFSMTEVDDQEKARDILQHDEQEGKTGEEGEAEVDEASASSAENS